MLLADTQPTMMLLDLLREAGEEPVTLDELEIVGVVDPARALWELELAGHHVQRVYEHPARGGSVTCVRLVAPARGGARAARRVTGPGAPPLAAALPLDPSPFVLGALLALLLLVLARRR
jgi:hypothetical protein